MRCFQVFQKIAPETALGIISFFREEETDSYKGTLLNLAQQKRLRPVFVQRKSKVDQAAWMAKSLSTLPADGLAEHLLQVWLLRKHTPMLTQFLDAVEIAHDGEGSVENLPAELEADKVKAGAEALLKDFDQEVVAIYLHVFNRQLADGWPALTELLDADPRLHLPPTEALRPLRPQAEETAGAEEEEGGAEAEPEEEESPEPEPDAAPAAEPEAGEQE